MSDSPPRFQEPGWFTRKVFNPLVAWLSRRGLSIAGSRVLEVQGRKSGEWRRTPVNPLTIGSERYLVAPRGNTQWVRNARAAGTGELRLGQRIEQVELVELPAGDRVPVLRVYLQKWGWEVGRFVEGLSKKSTDAEIAAVAPGMPVFRVRSAA
ncbi:MAG: nitroreductase/quinone reductase family protein [Solirubrobacterales bacterium]